MGGRGRDLLTEAKKKKREREREETHARGREAPKAPPRARGRHAADRPKGREEKKPEMRGERASDLGGALLNEIMWAARAARGKTQNTNNKKRGAVRVSYIYRKRGTWLPWRSHPP